MKMIASGRSVITSIRINTLTGRRSAASTLTLILTLVAATIVPARRSKCGAPPIYALSVLLPKQHIRVTSFSSFLFLIIIFVFASVPLQEAQVLQMRQ